MITALEQLDLSQRYSYADYLTWKFEQFVELFKGHIMPMAAPNRIHQRVSQQLNYTIFNFLKQEGRSCEVYVAPFDVRLVKNPLGKTDKEIYTVVQPDICVICDLSKLDARGCIGAPELIVEILSEGNATRDIRDKFDLYEESGVLEYWIVRPGENTVQQFFLENDKYAYKGTYTVNDRISAIAVPGLAVELAGVFG